MKNRYVGTSLKRVDGLDKVTGEARFVADLKFPGMTHLKVVRSPHAHARILSIDVEGARTMPGVVAVATGADLPWWVGECIRDMRCLAVDRVRWAGEPVVAVLGETADAAMAAADRIKVEYEPLPALIDVRDAYADGAEPIHPDLEHYHVLDGFRPTPGTNVFHHYQAREGDVKAAMAKADLVFERDYEFPHLMHAPLETHGVVARITPAGRLEIHSCGQSPFAVRSHLAEAFEMSKHDIVVRTGYVGGGFGCKSDATVEPLAAAMAMLVPGRYVRYVMTREECFVGSCVGRGFKGTYRYGVRKDGTLLAAEIDVLLAGGGYGWTAINIVPCGGHNGTGPYYFPTYEIHARGVYTNTPPVGAYRGYGHPDTQFMAERHMDFIARELGLDPVALRRRNLYHDGTPNILGQKIDESYGDIAGCIDRVSEDLGLEGKSRLEQIPADRPWIRRGRGMACLMKAPGMSTDAFSSCILKFNEDGTLHLISSFTDMGQGPHTAMKQITAEITELPIEDVYVARAIETDFSPYEWQTVASRTTWMQGRAIHMAWQRALKEMKATVAAVLAVDEERIAYGAGTFTVKDDERQLSVKEVCHGYVHEDGHCEGGPVIASGYFVPYSTHFDAETGKGEAAGSWTFGAQGCEIEVDTRTGQIDVKRFVTAMDVGRVVNPALAEAQVIGGVAYTLGGVLTETIVYGKQGEIRNGNFTDYKVPTPADMAGVEQIVHLLETPVPGDPIGTRCIGEHPSVAVAPALANALADATGLEFTDLPLSCERVFLALRKEGKDHA